MHNNLNLKKDSLIDEIERIVDSFEWHFFTLNSPEKTISDLILEYRKIQWSTLNKNSRD